MHISWQLIVLSLAYVGVLFIIAWHGDRNTSSFGGARASRWVYPLSIGVYATSWTYYGAVGSAADHGWEFLPIYLGPILVLSLVGRSSLNSMPLLKPIVLDHWQISCQPDTDAHTRLPF